MVVVLLSLKERKVIIFDPKPLGICDDVPIIVGEAVKKKIDKEGLQERREMKRISNESQLNANET